MLLPGNVANNETARIRQSTRRCGSLATGGTRATVGDAAAKTLGITVPQALLVAADEVIE
jgi:hypothetical protein